MGLKFSLKSGVTFRDLAIGAGSFLSRYAHMGNQHAHMGVAACFEKKIGGPRGHAPGGAAPLFWCAAAALRGADALCLFVCLLCLCVCLSCFLLCLLCVGLFGCLGLGILLLFSHMFFLQPDSLTIARVFCFYSRVLCFYSRVFCFYSRVFCFYSRVLCFYSRGTLLLF